MGKGTALLRDKRLWWGAGTVVVLAAVILGVAAISAPKESDRAANKPKPSIQAESLAKQAEMALSNGETATALQLAGQALDADPKNVVAQRVVERAEQPAPKPAANTDSEPDAVDPAKPAADPYVKPVSDMTSLLPVSVSGWSAGTVVNQKSEALVTFEPAKGAAHARTAVRALVIAHDRGSAANAQAFLSKVDKRVYTKDRSTVDIGGVDAYFATDGTRLAVVAFARGRYAFEVIMTAQPKVQPVALKPAGQLVASQLPAAK